MLYLGLDLISLSLAKPPFSWKIFFQSGENTKRRRIIVHVTKLCKTKSRKYRNKMSFLPCNRSSKVNRSRCKIPWWHVICPSDTQFHTMFTRFTTVSVNCFLHHIIEFFTCFCNVSTDTRYNRASTKRSNWNHLSYVKTPIIKIQF